MPRLNAGGPQYSGKFFVRMKSGDKRECWGPFDSADKAAQFAQSTWPVADAQWAIYPLIEPK